MFPPITDSEPSEETKLMVAELRARWNAQAVVVDAALAWHEMPIHSNIRALQAACVALKATKLTPPPETPSE